MSNINLSSGERNDLPETSIFNTGTIVVFIILILVLAVYAGAMFYQRTLDQKIASTKEQYKTEHDKLLAGIAKDVVDFQYRLDEAKESLDMSRNVRESLQAIERSMVAGSYLEKYTLDDETGTISLEGVADNYNVVARQILAFKSLPEFSSVKAGESSYDSENNKISYKADLQLIQVKTK